MAWDDTKDILMIMLLGWDSVPRAVVISELEKNQIEKLS